MAYEVWNQVSANMVGDFDTEAAALAHVRAAVQRHTTIALEWALAFEDDEGETTPIAAGRDLIARAFETQPQPAY